MKLAYRLLHHFTPLFILVLLALNLVPARPSLAAGPAQPAETPPYSIFMPVIGRGEAPAWFGPDGGSAIFIAADPNNSAIFYAGSSGAGVYKSYDGGASWHPASQGLGNLTIYCLAIEPDNSSVIYAGTYGGGVYKTIDGAANWFPVSRGMNLPSVVYSLAVNPGNHNLVYASTRLQDTLDGVLYKSGDGGANWEAVFKQSSDWVYSLAVNPNAPNIILAATHEHGPYIAGSYGGWGDWQPASIEDGEWYKGRAVAFDPRAGTRRSYFSAWHGDFYRSSNNGQSWVEYNQGLGASHVYPNGIVVKPSSPDTVYMAAHSSDVAGVLKSTDAGASWRGAGLLGSTVYTVAAAASGDTVLAGTYLDGIYRSTNGGASWGRSYTGFSNTQVSGVALYGGRIIAATVGSGLQQSLDGGFSWGAFNGGLSDLYINGLAQNPIYPNILFALASNAGLYQIDLKSGSGWQPASVDFALGSAPAAGLLTSRPTSPLVRREALDEFLALEGEAPTSGLAPAAFGGIPLQMVFAPSNPSYVYLGTTQGLYVTTNGGVSWTQRLSGMEVRGVAIHPQDPNRVYVATSQVGYIKTSTNAGQTWMDISTYGNTVHSLVVTTGSPERVYMATDFGVLRFEGTQWQWADGYKSKVTVLAINPARPGLVYAGTEQGIYVTGDSMLMLPIATGFAVQSFSFDPADPYHVYTGTVSCGTLRFRMN